MKLLHTADWHVGRPIRGRSRADEHRAVLAEIAGIAEAEAVDAVLVVGDLFDTAAPTAESEGIVYDALLHLAATGATVVVLSGNHDNDRRLQAVAPLLSLGRVVCRPVFAPAADGGVVELRSRDGRERAQLACLPFLSQRYVVRAAELVDEEAAQHQLDYSERMRRLVGALTAGFTSAADIHLLAAHCMVLGATLTGSERQGQSVFEYSVSAAAFPPHLQYVALGHLHRQQAVAGPVPAHYSGSPLALDFGEAGDPKGILVVDVAAGQPARVRPVPLTAGRRLRVVEGTLAELGQMEVGDDWVKAVVRDQAGPGLADEVRGLLPNAVDVSILRPDAPMAGPAADRRVGRAPHELFADYLQVRDVDGAALIPLFAELLDEVMTAATGSGGGGP